MGTGERNITIFLADDDATVRSTLRTFFADHPDYTVVGEACDGASAVEACETLRPDVTLLDIQMPVLDGISAAKIILDSGFSKCVIMLTAFGDQGYVQDALQAGAFGYLTKPFEPDKILPTIELCIHQSKAHHLLRKEQRHLTQRLNERSLIDRAKLLIMESKHMAEVDAYQYIRELSYRKGISMAKVSKYLIAQMEDTYE